MGEKKVFQFFANYTDSCFFNFTSTHIKCAWLLLLPLVGVLLFKCVKKQGGKEEWVFCLDFCWVFCLDFCWVFCFMGVSVFLPIRHRRRRRSILPFRQRGRPFTRRRCSRRRHSTCPSLGRSLCGIRDWLGKTPVPLGSWGCIRRSPECSVSGFPRW